MFGRLTAAVGGATRRCRLGDGGRARLCRRPSWRCGHRRCPAPRPRQRRRRSGPLQEGAPVGLLIWFHACGARSDRWPDGGAGAGARRCGRFAAQIARAAELGSAHAAGAAPDCEPTTLNTSATLGGSVTVSPLPGSRDASPQTQISFLGVPKGELSRDQRRRLAHRRAQRVASRATRRATARASCRAGHSREGETVTVSAQVRTGGAVQPLLDSFTIAYQDTLTTTPETIHTGELERDPGLPLAPGPAPADGHRDRELSRRGARR